MRAASSSIRRHRDVQETVLDLEFVARQRLSRLTRGTSRSDTRWVENAVVTGAVEPIVLRLPAYLASQVGAYTGERDEVVAIAIARLPSDVDGLTRRSSITNRLANAHAIRLDHEQPQPIVPIDGVEVAQGDRGEASISAGNPGHHRGLGGLT